MKSRMDVERMEAGSSDPAELLRAELMAVEPSPGFAAGVRARVKGQRVPRQTLWLAAAASLGLVTWASVSTPIKPEAETGNPAAAMSEAAAPTPSVIAEAPPAAKPRRAAAPLVTREPLATVDAAESRLDVLVPPDQAIAVRRLLLMHGAGRRFALASDGHAVDEVTGTLLELAPIEIPKITIELLPGPEPGVGGKIK